MEKGESKNIIFQKKIIKIAVIFHKNLSYLQQYKQKPQLSDM